MNVDGASRPRAVIAFDRGFVDEHDRDIVANRINAAASDAAQTAVVGFQFHPRLTGRTNKNLEQIGADCHILPILEGRQFFFNRRIKAVRRVDAFFRAVQFTESSASAPERLLDSGKARSV